jgi:hypothetical protein
MDMPVAVMAAVASPQGSESDEDDDALEGQPQVPPQQDGTRRSRRRRPPGPNSPPRQRRTAAQLRAAAGSALTPEAEAVLDQLAAAELALTLVRGRAAAAREAARVASLDADGELSAAIDEARAAEGDLERERVAVAAGAVAAASRAAALEDDIAACEAANMEAQKQVRSRVETWFLTPLCFVLTRRMTFLSTRKVGCNTRFTRQHSRITA